MVRRAVAGALSLACITAFAAAQTPAEAPPAGHKAPSPAVATVAGTPIDLAEVDELIKPQLLDMRSREYQLRSQAMEILIGRTLIEKEAKARGLTPEALDQAEVVAKAVVTDAEVKTAYTNNKARFPNVPEATALEQIRAQLQQQRQTERRTAYTRELRGKYDV